MKLIPLIFLTSAILMVLLAAFGFRLFFDKNAKLPDGSCRNKNKGLADRGINCSCGSEGGINCDNKPD